MSAMVEGIEYYGANGITAFDRNSAFAKLTPDQREFAYNEGKKYAKTTFAILENAAKKSETAYNRKMGRVFFEAGVKARSELEKQSVNLARVVSIATGIDIRFFDSTKDARKSNFNGRYDGATGTIWLDIKAGDAHNGLVSFAMAHELTHFIKQWSPSKYAVLSQLVISELEASGADINELVEKQMAKNKNLIPNEALEEVVCDALESMLLDSDKAASTLEKLCRKDKSLAQKIVSHLAEIIKRLRQLLIGIAPDSTEGKILRGMKDSYEKLETAFSEALEEAATNHKAAMRKNTAKAAENTEAGVKYSKRTDSSPEVVSIKQQLENAKDELEKTPLAAEKKVDVSFSKWSKKEKIRWAINEIKKRGQVVDRQGFGKVKIENNDINRAADYFKNDGEYAAFSVLYDVIKRGKVIYKENNHKGRGYDTVTFAAPVKINGVLGNMAVVIRQTQGLRYDVHRIVMPDGGVFTFSKTKETAAGPVAATPQSDALTQPTETVSNNSISNSAENVNTEVQISQGNGEKFFLRNGAENYDYDTLVSKPDMKVTEVDETNIPKNRADVVAIAKRNVSTIGKYDAKTATASVYVKDIGTDVVLSTNGLKHGLDRRFNENAAVTVKAGEILQNAICVNELIPNKAEAAKSYVLIGTAKNTKGDLYLVRAVVNRFNSELTSMDVLYAINAKKESQPRSMRPGFQGPVTDSNISISNLLDYVNRYFPDVLPESVLKHFGHTERPEGKIGESALFSRRSPYAKTDREALISALERSEKVSDSDKAKLEDYKDKLDMLDGFERYLDEIGEEMKALAATDGRQGARGACRPLFNGF